jgi:hypothetical protein
MNVYEVKAEGPLHALSTVVITGCHVTAFLSIPNLHGGHLRPLK